MPQETSRAKTSIAFSDEQRASSELVKLIRKLRWIGMEEEAQKMQASLSEIPPDERATVSASVPNTD
jgi:hypothetical protein